MWLRFSSVTGCRVVSIHGKTVRGARTAHTTAPHLVAALEHTLEVVLGQMQVTEKSNEIPAVRDLLASFAPAHLAGAVVTTDAMHTQIDTAQAILDAGADYVFTVKRNQPPLYRRLAALPWEYGGIHVSSTTELGRRVTRTMQLVIPGDDLGFPGIQQATRMERVRRHGDTVTTEVVFVITSADHLAAPPQTLAAWVQGHWAIENKFIGFVM